MKTIHEKSFMNKVERFNPSCPALIAKLIAPLQTM